MLKKYLTQITQELKVHKENYGLNHITTARTMYMPLGLEAQWLNFPS